MATLSSIHAWKILWTEEPGGLHPWGRKELDMTEQLHSLTQPGIKFSSLLLYPKETDPDLPVDFQESPAEVWISSGLLQGWGSKNLLVLKSKLLYEEGKFRSMQFLTNMIKTED